jgi:hypothetical protein
MELLDLPSELLICILQFTRPDGFESFLLTCKAIYAIGFNLIQDHNFCKKWIRQHTRGRSSWAGCILLENPIELLMPWLTVSSTTKTEFLMYLDRVDVQRAYYNTQSLLIPRPRRILQREEALVIYDIVATYKRIPDLVPDCENHHQSLGFCLLDSAQNKVKDAMDTCKISVNTGIHDLTLLSLLPNLRLLVLGSHSNDERRPDFVQFLGLNTGIECFQNLHDLHLQAPYVYTFQDLRPLLALPRLETLAVNNLTSEHENKVDNGNNDSNDNNGMNTTLKRLIIFNANATPNSLGNFLRHLQALHTFVWENTSSWPDAEQEHQSALNQDWTEEEYGDLVLWNPLEILRQVQRYNKQTIECLTISMVMEYGLYRIENQNQIKDFVEFNHLRYLDYDTRLVRSIRAHCKESSIGVAPLSLATILPPKIQDITLRFVDHGSAYEDVFESVQSLASENLRFRNLRSIKILMADCTTVWVMDEISIPQEVETKVGLLKDMLNQINITLEVKAAPWDEINTVVQLDSSCINHSVSKHYLRGV